MSFRDPTNPENWAPIDDEARDGEAHLVRADGIRAVGRWVDDGWVYPASGTAFDFEPDSYLLEDGI